MRTRVLTIASVTVMLVSVFPAVALASGVGMYDGSELAEARRATARFHDAAEAIADGYASSGSCFGLPALGAMGDHYFKLSLMDMTVDASTPELLLYVPGANGEPRLVGVEYFKADQDQNLATDSDRPSLFGRAFDGPMPGHFPGQPIHYDLHVWIWQANPAGLFASFNPNLTC